MAATSFSCFQCTDVGNLSLRPVGAQTAICISKPIQKKLKRAFASANSEKSEFYSLKDQNERSDVLRSLLRGREIIQGPCCYDALSSKLVEMAGFPVAVMSGFSVSASRLGLPDTGLLSYGEMAEQVGLISSSISIPLIADADTGYGNALNVKRTVKGYQKAGAAALIIEDQVWPKGCGHTRGRQVVSREEALARMKAAIDARDECGGNILVVARSDAMQAESLEEALWRSQAFADMGADLVFVDALSSKSDMAALCKAVPDVPKMANILEGGVTPVLSPLELQDLGFKLVVYPLSLLGVSIRAMQDALVSLKSGRIPPPSALPRFEEIKSVVGFPKYYEEEQRYSPSSFSAFVPRSRQQSPPASNQEAAARAPACTGDFECDDDAPTQVREPESPPKEEPRRVREVVTPLVLEEGEDPSDGLMAGGNGSWAGRNSGQRYRMLRLRVTGKDGIVKIDFRVPAGFLDGLVATFPVVGGFDLKEMLGGRGVTDSADGGAVVDVTARDGTGDRVQIFIE